MNCYDALHDILQMDRPVQAARELDDKIIVYSRFPDMFSVTHVLTCTCIAYMSTCTYLHGFINYCFVFGVYFVVTSNWQQ